MDDVRPATRPIEIKMPNGTAEKSTHTCQLRIPDVPRETKEAHVVQGLSHSSLISMKKFCKEGCEVKFKEETCEIYYRENLVLTGKNAGPGGLWSLISRLWQEGIFLGSFPGSQNNKNHNNWPKLLKMYLAFEVKRLSPQYNVFCQTLHNISYLLLVYKKGLSTELVLTP